MNNDRDISDIYKSKILIVDDFKDNLELIKDILEDKGYENIICVLSAKEAYKELAKNNIDLILLDIMMPEINGIEACKHIKNDVLYKDIPIIIVTAKADLQTLKSSFEAGASDYIRKPILNEIELIARVENALTLKVSIDRYKKLTIALDEKVQQELEKNRYKEQLLMQQSKQAQMGEMMSMTAHQWRQPLNAVSASAIQLNMKNDMKIITSEDIKETTCFIEKMTQEMSSTINNFMNFSKPTHKKELFSIKQILEDILRLMGAQLKNHNIAFISDIKEDITLFIYKKDLEHILINLIVNARDAFDSKEIEEKKIFIKAYLKDKRYIIEVIDNAGGIPGEVLERVFEPYFTTKEQGKGTGLGLYMSKKIARENLDGDIDVQNLQDGALFHIELKQSYKE